MIRLITVSVFYIKSLSTQILYQACIQVRSLENDMALAYLYRFACTYNSYRIIYVYSSFILYNLYNINFYLICDDDFENKLNFFTQLKCHIILVFWYFKFFFISSKLIHFTACWLCADYLNPSGFATNKICNFIKNIRL